MREYTEDQLYDMSDEELEAAFNEVKNSEEFDLSEETTEEPVEDNSEEETIDELDEEDEEDLEQPDEEDSDDNSVEDEEETESEEDSEAESDEPEEESDEEEEQPDEDDEESKEEAQPDVEEYKLKANGVEYTFTKDEIVQQFPSMFAKAKDYTKKMQAIKPWRKTIDALETANISHDDINLMIDVLKGDKGAVTEVLKRTGVDALELDTDGSKPYVANDYGRDATALDLKDVVESIKTDPEYATTHKILSSEWDDKSWETLSKEPELVAALHADVKSGMFNTLRPIADKLKLFSGGNKSDLEYYGEAAKQYFSKQREVKQRQEKEKRDKEEELRLEAERVKKAKEEKAKRLATQKASQKRKAAVSTRKSPTEAKATDLLDAYDDESYYEWVKKVEGN